MSAPKRHLPFPAMGGQQMLLLAAFATAGVVLVAALFGWSSDGKASSTVSVKKRVGLPVGEVSPRYAPASANGSAIPDEGPDNAAARRPKLPASLDALLAKMRKIALLPDSPERDKELQALVNALPEQDVSAIVVFLGKTLPFGITDPVLGKLVTRWANLNINATAFWIDGLQAGSLREQTADSVAILWANKDVSGVSHWIAQWPEGKDRDEVVTNIAYEAARQKPEEAMNLAMDLLPDEPMSKLITYATAQWATVAPADAAKWAEQIDDKSLRDQSLVSVATSWAVTDPAAAASLALKDLPVGRQQQDAVVGIVERWTQIDPEGAAEWVGRFSGGTLRDTAVANMVSLWTDKDPSAVSQWLKALPLGPFRDAAVGTYVNKVAVSSPNEAARWANVLHQPQSE